MKWAIYDVNEKIDYLLEKYMNPQTGELAPEAVVQLEALGMERSMLIKNLALAKKRNDVYITGMKEEQKRLGTRIASAEKSSYWLLQQVQNNITEGETIKDDQYEVKWSTSTKLIIDEFDHNAEIEFKDKTPFKKWINKKVETTFAFDKTAIKKFLSLTDKDGKFINKLEGMSILKTKNLLIK